MLEGQDTSLDKDIQIAPLVWTVKQKRAYHRVMSGLTRYRYQGEAIRFLTLTTSLESLESGLSLRKSWDTLRKRINRRGPIEYIMFKTAEGNGVLHILFVGRYIPQKWLSEQWLDIHKSKIVDVRVLRGKSKGIAGYLVGRYCSGQAFVRYSLSRNWVFRGFVRYWRMLMKCAWQVWKEEYFYTRWRFFPYLLAVWRLVLCGREPPILDDYAVLYQCCFFVGVRAVGNRS